jgi:hypothetical protein
MNDIYAKIDKYHNAIYKEAAPEYLGDPESVGRYLASIIHFLVRRISAERRPHSIENLKKKIYYLNEYDMAAKKTPASSSLGQSITLVKTLLLSHNPEYIRKVLNSVVRSL